MGLVQTASSPNELSGISATLHCHTTSYLIIILSRLISTSKPEQGCKVVHRQPQAVHSTEWALPDPFEFAVWLSRTHPSIHLANFSFLTETLILSFLYRNAENLRICIYKGGEVSFLQQAQGIGVAAGTTTSARSTP